MTASELVEKLQMIIKREGDFEIEYLDEMSGERGYSWSYSLKDVTYNKHKRVINIS